MANELDFSGKSVLITGASSGIGAACAMWLDGHGAAGLVLVDRDAAGLERLGLKAATFVGDVADPALWERIEAVHKREGVGKESSRHDPGVSPL